MIRSAGTDFWSRRKAAVAVETKREADERVREAEAASTEAETEAARSRDEARSDAEILGELGLPDPDTLGKGDDFSVFMRSVVPDRIRRRALRRLWVSNPILANLDELVDYGEDFTDAATVVDNLATAYQVGKGMLHHVLAMPGDDPETDPTSHDAEADDPGNSGNRDQSRSDIITTDLAPALSPETDSLADVTEPEIPVQPSSVHELAEGSDSWDSPPSADRLETVNPIRRMRFRVSSESPPVPTSTA